MVHDALREVEEKGITPEASWMDALKAASATAFLGTLLHFTESLHSRARNATFQLHQSLYAIQCVCDHRYRQC